MKLQLPSDSVVVVPRELLPAKSSTVVPASAVPVKVGVVSPVRLSVSESPVSEAAVRSGAEGEAGAMVIVRAEEIQRLLRAAEYEWSSWNGSGETTPD